MSSTNLQPRDDHSVPGRLATLFLDNRHLLALTVAVLIVAGLSALSNLPRIEDPRITNRNPVILTVMPGASAARMEALVTKKIEDALKTVSEIKRIESTSRPGISVINVELQDGIGRDTNQEVFTNIRAKLDDVERELPQGASKPEFDDMRGAVAYSLIASISWRGGSDARLGVLARMAEELGDRLRQLPGTEDVRLFGAPEEEVTVTVDPAELVALGLSGADVASATAAADAKAPAGVLRTDRHEVLLEIDGALDTLERVRSVPLIENGSGAVVRIGDVATVTKGWQDPPRQVARAEGARAVLVAARVETDVRVDHWSELARGVIADFGTGVDSRIEVDIAFDQSRYTEDRLANLGGNLLAGAAVVVLVVLIGMGWRAALIVGAALPLSGAFTLFGLALAGQQIHQMTIFGLIIAIGLLIDNAIVITDEVRRRLGGGLSRSQAMGESVRHLFSPLLASTLTTILGFMPIFLLPGNVGDFVGSIAISVVLALVGSFLISMTVIAALAALFAAPSADEAASRWWRGGVSSARLAGFYRRSLLAILAHPRKAIAVVLVLPLAGFALATTLGNQFFPPADRDQLEVKVWLSSDASLERTTRTMAGIEEAIRGFPGIERVDWVAGASFPSVYYNLLQDQDDTPSYGQAIVTVDGIQRASTLIAPLQASLDERFPYAQVVVAAFGQGPPVKAPVAFRLVGPGLDVLRQLGEQLRGVMHQQPDIIHTRASVTGGEAKLWFRANEEEARMAGLTLSQIAAQFQGNLEGRIGGTLFEDLEELPVRIRYANEQRGSLARIASLNLIGTGTGWVPASALGELVLEPELSAITRRDGERVNEVLGYMARGALPIEITRSILEQLQETGFELPVGYRLEVAGDSEEQGRAISQLMTYLPVLVVLMIATVVLSFRSVLLAGIIGVVALLSIGLGMLSLWLSGYPLGFNPILGSAGLVGVAINGTIVVLAAIRASAAARVGESAAIVEQTVASTRHILSTTVTTMAGFVPLLVFTGGQFWPPLAVVIAGGVGFSVLLSLVFTPAAYRLIYGRRAQAARSESGARSLPLPARP